MSRRQYGAKQTTHSTGSLQESDRVRTNDTHQRHDRWVQFVFCRTISRWIEHLDRINRLPPTRVRTFYIDRHKYCRPNHSSRFQRYFIIEMVIVLHLLFLIVIFVILPNYRMVNYDSIFNLSSGVRCNWCIQLDARLSLALMRVYWVLSVYVTALIPLNQ